MNQAFITLAIQQVMPAAIATGLFVSLFTAQEPVPVIGPTGAVEFDYVNVSDATLVNVPCTAPPPSASDIQATEVRALEEITASELHHVLLAGYFPQLDAGWRGENADGKGACIALIDGFNYEISGVESDSQSTQTRVRVKLASV